MIDAALVIAILWLISESLRFIYPAIFRQVY